MRNGIIEACEEDEGSSSRYYPMAYEDGSRRGSYRGSYRRDSMGRYAREGYSRDASLANALRDMMGDVPDEHTKAEMQRLINKLSRD